MTAIVLSILLVPISLIAMRYRARCNELQRAAVADAVHRADYANRRDREVAQLQRTIATLVRERDDAVRSEVESQMRLRGGVGWIGIALQRAARLPHEERSTRRTMDDGSTRAESGTMVRAADEAERVLGRRVHPATLRSWSRRGRRGERLRVVQGPNRVLYCARGEVLRWLAATTAGGAGPDAPGQAVAS